ncbi:isochorismatase [Acinetobacter sp. AG1]|uniref:cysteine hydrolase family protein n=1 Tax=Acinetobacter TaxID=469 RepID=UPI0006290D4A|nr:cysteine hydrolase family protein [Acinetobacter sp. AG1]KKW81984.1 isochorismatase [Acinetobacter sp. AG1]
MDKQSFKSKLALLVIDMQNGLFKGNVNPHNVQLILSNINRLIEHQRLNEMPIIFIRHVGERGTPLDPECLNTQLIDDLQFDPLKDLVIEKKYPSCFKNTFLKELLDKLFVDEVLITGMKTEYCIDTTVRIASEYGYKVVLASDAHTTFDSAILNAGEMISYHNQILNNVFAKVQTSEEYITLI